MYEEVVHLGREATGASRMRSNEIRSYASTADSERSDGRRRPHTHGSTPPITRIDEHERLFQQRTDEQVRSLLGAIGHLIAFETWGWFDNGSHYQWAAIEIG